MVLAQRPECARVAASSLAKRPTRRTINSKNAKSGVNNPGFKTKHRSMASFRRCPSLTDFTDFSVRGDLLPDLFNSTFRCDLFIQHDVLLHNVFMPNVKNTLEK